jgi:hypothetical protein
MRDCISVSIRLVDSTLMNFYQFTRRRMFRRTRNSLWWIVRLPLCFVNVINRWHHCYHCYIWIALSSGYNKNAYAIDSTSPWEVLISMHTGCSVQYACICCGIRNIPHLNWIRPWEQVINGHNWQKVFIPVLFVIPGNGASSFGKTW